MIGTTPRGRRWVLVRTVLVAVLILAPGLIAVPAMAAPPANAIVPTVSGDPVVGSTLTAWPGRWSGTPLPTFGYQWQSQSAGATDWQDITGARSNTYDVQPDDVGRLIRVAVTATNGDGPAQVVGSGPTPAVTDAPQRKPDAPPPPPNDALGTPRNSRVVSDDDLLVTENVNTFRADPPLGANADTRWSTQVVGTDGTGDITQAPTFTGAAGIQREDRHGAQAPASGTGTQNVVGRFADSDNDGVLTVSAQNREPAGNDFDLVVSSTSEAARDQVVELGGSPLTAGRVYAVRNPASGRYLGQQLTAAGYAPGTLGELSTDAWWYAMADPAGSDFVQLVNQATGLCLAARGSFAVAISTEPCVLSGPIPDEQFFRSRGNLLVAKFRDGQFAVVVATDGSISVTPIVPNQPAPPEAVWNAYGRAGAGEPASDPGEEGRAGGTVPTWRTGGPPSVVEPGFPPSPLTMAAGDLDRVAPESNGYHYQDEVVVAWANGGFTDDDPHITVLDYGQQAQRVTATVQPIPVPQFAVLVDVSVGDFDGDGLNEIAVIWKEDSADGDTTHIAFYSYRAQSDGSRALTRLDPTVTIGDAGDGMLDDASVVTADFDGDLRDDLAMAGGGLLQVLTFTPELSVRGRVDYAFTTNSTDIFTETDVTFSARATQAAAGLFRFDPEAGYTMERRQIAIAWSESTTPDDQTTTETYVSTFSVDVDPDQCSDQVCPLTVTELTPRSTGTTLLQRTDHPLNDGPTLPLSLAAGGFKGRGATGDAPIWGLAVSFNDATPEQVRAGEQASRLILLAPQDDGTMATLSDRTLPASSGAPTGAIFHTLSPIDVTGDSLMLGAPFIVTSQQFSKPTLIAAQAPSHADWFPDLGDDGDGDFANVSRYTDFTVELGSDSATQYTHTFTSTSGWNAGLTASASVKYTFEAGLGDLVKAKGSLEVSSKFAKKWSGSQKDFSKYSTTFSTTIKQRTDDDDLVQGTVQDTTLYRYPIIGGTLKNPDGTPVTDPVCGSACYGVYDIVVPGRMTPINGAGRALEFYAPPYQNGNVLSYPRLDGGDVPTPDLGSYTYIDPQGAPRTVTGTLFNTLTAVGGTRTTATFKIDSETGTGNTTTTAGSWQLSGQVKATAGITAKTPFGGAGATGTITVGASGGQNITTNDGGKTTNSSGSEFTLDVPPIDVNRGYQIGTAYYYDSSGTARVAMAADVTADATGSAWWRENYSTPDVALNQPGAQVLTTDAFGQRVVPEFNTTEANQQIRGFRSLHVPDPNRPGLTDWTTNPVPGDQVVFTVPVYNYSLRPISDVPVTFYAVPVDEDEHGLLMPVQPPTRIGETTITQTIPPNGRQSVSVPQPWTAQTLPGRSSSQVWRIFVVLNENGAIKDETHPWKGGAPCPKKSLDITAARGTVVDGRMIDWMTGKPTELACGQNNQGYGEITVGSGSAGPTDDPSGPAGAVLARAQGDPAGVRFSGVGMVTGEPDHLALEPGEQAVLQQNAFGTVIGRVTGDRDSLEHQLVLAYDGEPGMDNLIGAVSLRGVADGEGEVRVPWRATTPGLHTIHLRLLGSSTAGADDETTATVLVTAPRPVVPADPAVTQAACQAGRSGDPSVTPASTTGLDYTVGGDAVPGGTVTVTATPQSGFVISGPPPGWTPDGRWGASFTVTLAAAPTCGATTPTTPTPVPDPAPTPVPGDGSTPVTTAAAPIAYVPPEPGATTPDAPAPAARTASGSLPDTGVDVGGRVLLAVLLVTAGAAAIGLSRRRRPGPRR